MPLLVLVQARAGTPLYHTFNKETEYQGHRLHVNDVHNHAPVTWLLLEQRCLGMCRSDCQKYRYDVHFDCSVTSEYPCGNKSELRLHGRLLQLFTELSVVVWYDIRSAQYLT